MEQKKTFPIIHGYNLEDKEYFIPDTLDKKYNLLIMPFWRAQQKNVDTWVDSLNFIEENFDDFKYYELPTISYGFSWMRGFIDGGMKSGIPNKKSRERTITLYLKKSELINKLNIQTQKNIHLFLVEKKSGEILWRETGDYTEDKLNSLKNIINQFN